MELSSLAILALVAAAIIVLAIFFTFVPVMLWISALAAGVRISIFTLVGARLRRVIPKTSVNPLI
uniref:flotillin-like FloA family protein n=1 Tax=Bacillus cereus TaxID=1396 RepID=UPI0020BDCD57